MSSEIAISAGSPKGARVIAANARRLMRPSTLQVGMIMLAPLVALAIAGAVLAPYNPLKVDSSAVLEGPSLSHLMGTDDFGRDVFSRTIVAARLDLLVAGSVAIVIVFVGGLLGGLVGYYGGVVDDLVMRLVDVVMAFPAFVLSMVITFVLGNNTGNLILALSISYSPYFVRIVRSEMLSLRKMDFAKAAVCVGNPPWRVMYRHLLPNCLGPVVVQASLAMGWSILDTGGLSFLGIGVKPPTCEWGVIVSTGAKFVLTGEWWTWLFAGAAIVYAVCSFNVLAEGLRQRLLPEHGESRE